MVYLVGLISWGAKFAQLLLVSGYFSAGRLFCYLSLDVPWSQGTNMCFHRVPLWRPAKASFALLNAGFSTPCARVSSRPMWLEHHWRLSQWSAFSSTRARPGGFPGSAGVSGWFSLSYTLEPPRNIKKPRCPGSILNKFH